MNWYTNPKWLRIRSSVLRRDKYQDQEAKRYGIVSEAEVVHHIFPREKYPQYEYEMWNLISVSRKTHNMFHDRDTDELTEKGKDLLRRTCRKYRIEIPPEYELLPPKKRSKGFKKDGYYY